MNRVMLKNISLVGLHLPAYREKDPAKLPEAMQALLAMYTRGALRVIIAARYPLAEAATALQEISQRRVQGKVVLTA
jgi:NADPH2:quinone reductase